ncbi:WW domain-binding protein 4 [Acyrthosiphon pisum]|uniref:ACYPI000884 protein n=1 Tax=Acyrthosiphon pisum TaxID=7029 RepID=C4WRV9_ACYPI|nr:WW domain-binding protein 4 [Acyrthosiphon pisum]BAH70629.1 ACYPI000884 [Acyrthosiphon pisum]|eukprot:NP_001280281.1 WW domain-binding protein 4 [Acyrthosiphon pisum]
MTEFWKSTGKKFCDFCKCWIADNKPSIQFHENGKRHQISVAKRLVDIKKNSAIERKEEQKMEMDMKRMEQNAMKAYYNDITNNPDYSSQVLIKEKGLCIRPTPYMMTPQPTGPHVNISYSKNNMPVSIKQVAAPKPEFVWHQSRTDDGSDLMYYWNTETGESVWEPPAEGFLSVAEQEAEENGKGNGRKRKGQQEQGEGGRPKRKHRPPGRKPNGKRLRTRNPATTSMTTMTMVTKMLREILLSLQCEVYSNRSWRKRHALDHGERWKRFSRSQ